MSNFGIDLLFESQRVEIKSKNDILVIFMHWMLCKNDLRNVGVGDDKYFNEDDRASELLPELWNSDQNAYALRYTHNKQIFILHGIVSSDTLILNLLDASTLKTASLVFHTEKVVKSKTGRTLSDFVYNSEELIKRIEDEMVKPIFKKPAAATSPELTTQPNPLLVHPPRAPVNPYFFDEGIPSFRDPLRDIGRGDLDPFGRGGGMLFQPGRPFGPGGGFGPLGPLPHPGPLGIPPGARYDPPNPLRRLDPDNDHFPPPGNPPPGYDDMFM